MNGFVTGWERHFCLPARGISLPIQLQDWAYPKAPSGVGNAGRRDARLHFDMVRTPGLEPG